MISHSPNQSSNQLSQRFLPWLSPRLSQGGNEAEPELAGSIRPCQGAEAWSVQPHANAPLSILLIDDEPGICLLLHQGLATQGHRIYEANDGVTGLAQFHALHPDLILLDGHMPGMDGFAVLKELRCYDTIVGIIMVSAISAKGLMNSALYDGADGYLIKPVHLSQILNETQRVGAIVRQRRCPIYAAK